MTAAREILRRLLRQIVACVDDAVFMPTDEHAGMVRSPAGLQRVVCAVDRHRRRPDRGLLRKPVFERLQRGVARLEAKDAAVTVDHDIDEVGIFECDRRPGERRLIEPPAGRPFAPQDPGELAAVFGQAFAPALGLEEMLIPEDPLERRRHRPPLSPDIDHVVARVGTRPPIRSGHSAAATQDALPPQS